MWLLGLVLLAVLLVLGARWLHARRPRERQRREIKALLLACNGNQELAERLMLGEMERDPSIGFTEAARRAQQRLRRDRA